MRTFAEWNEVKPGFMEADLVAHGGNSAEGGFLSSCAGTAVSYGIGVMLLLAGQAMAAGTFTVGDFALFVYYLWFTTELPLDLGAFVGD